MDFFAWIATLQVQFICFAMCLSIPSIVLYLAEIVTIVRHQKFHTSFYALFVARAVEDILYTLSSYYGYRIPALFGGQLYALFVRLPPLFSAAFTFLTNSSFQADYLSTALILVNRLSAVTIPWKKEKLWRKYLPVVLAAIFGIPLLGSCQYLFMEHIVIPEVDANNATTAFLIMLKNPTDVSNLTFQSALVSFVFILICSLINLATLVAYKLVKKKTSVGNDAEDGAERKLLVYSIVTFVGHMLIALLMIAQYLFVIWQDTGALLFLITQYDWIMDSGTVVMSSWLLLWGSDSFRQQFAADFLPKRWAHLLMGASGTAAAIPVSTTVKVQSTAGAAIDGRVQKRIQNG